MFHACYWPHYQFAFFSELKVVHIPEILGITTIKDVDNSRLEDFHSRKIMLARYYIV